MQLDLRRIRRYEWSSALLGAVLFGVMFADWYRAGRAHATAWHAFHAIDVVIAGAGLSALALALVCATQRSGAIPQAMSVIVTLVCIVAALLVVIRTLILPSPQSITGSAGPAASVGREAGLWVGLASSLALVCSAWLSMSDERTPAASRRPLEVTRLPAPAAGGERGARSV